MAHAITDALTPAHQYPMTDKIIEISGKKPEERDKLIKKMFLSGENWRERILNNWEYNWAKRCDELAYVLRNGCSNNDNFGFSEKAFEDARKR